MANPLYISLGFSLSEIAAMSKLVGFFAAVAGALIGGVVTVRFGILRSLLICGILQALGNLFFVLQAMEGHRIGYLALCVSAENLTGTMAGSALVAYLSSLCSPEFTATQYALLSSLAVVGRTLVASSSGLPRRNIRLDSVLSADDGGHDTGAGAADLDRAGGRETARAAVAFGRV